jgi:uncharacterized protein YecE (DUF72 family)
MSMDISQMKENMFFSGTSGLLLPFPNKQLYPIEFQDKPRLAFYGSLFNSLEINSSFYKIPLASTIQKWSDNVPDHFKFTFKLWKGITHNKDLAFDPDSVDHFLNVINYAGTKKGCLLIQFPPSVTASKINQLMNLLRALRLADAENKWKMALEFRHSSWYEEDLEELSTSFQMGIVIHDKTNLATSLPGDTPDFIYLRFHGPDGNYRGTYTQDTLMEYAHYIKEWIDEEKVVYTYFNNTMGDAIKNLETLNHFVNTI